MEGLGKVVTEGNRLNVACEGRRGESRVVNRGHAFLFPKIRQSPGYREALKMLVSSLCSFKPFLRFQPTSGPR